MYEGKLFKRTVRGKYINHRPENFSVQIIFAELRGDLLEVGECQGNLSNRGDQEHMYELANMQLCVRTS